MNNAGVHATHCCVRHGCKYGDSDCPVVGGTVPQRYPCEFCALDAEEQADVLERLRPQLRAVYTDVAKALDLVKGKALYDEEALLTVALARLAEIDPEVKQP